MSDLHFCRRILRFVFYLTPFSPTDIRTAAETAFVRFPQKGRKAVLRETGSGEKSERGHYRDMKSRATGRVWIINASQAFLHIRRLSLPPPGRSFTRILHREQALWGCRPTGFLDAGATTGPLRKIHWLLWESGYACKPVYRV